MLKSHSGGRKPKRLKTLFQHYYPSSRRLLFASVILTNLERLSFVSQRNIKCLNIFWYIANLFICYNFQNSLWLKICKSKKILSLLIVLFHFREDSVSYSPVIPYKRKGFPSFDIPFPPSFSSISIAEAVYALWFARLTSVIPLAKKCHPKLITSYDYTNSVS